jgi:hypothetical protein
MRRRTGARAGVRQKSRKGRSAYRDAGSLAQGPKHWQLDSGVVFYRYNITNEAEIADAFAKVHLSHKLSTGPNPLRRVMLQVIEWWCRRGESNPHEV